MSKQKRRTLTLEFGIVLALIQACASVKNVTISKCCPFDEYLSPNDAKCLRPYADAPADLQWRLKVFNRAKQTYLEPQNRIPANWHLKAGSRPACARPALLAAPLGKYVPFQNGSVFLIEYNRLVHPRHYCLDYGAALLCVDGGQPEAMAAAVRVRECCGPEGIFSETNKTCISVRDPTYRIELGAGKVLGVGLPDCGRGGMAFVGRLERARIHDNGSLTLAESRTLIPVGNYCLEHVLENAGRSASIMVCEEFLDPTVSVKESQPDDLRFTIYPIGLALSAIFLAATLAAGALLPASHHVLHWRCQTNHVVCLLVGDVLLCITHLSGRMEPVPCVLIAVCMHFVFLAAFFWLNTMCFNIWWTFRDLRPQSVEKSQERCRLRFYELYAWGGPLVIAGTGAILHLVPTSSDILKPNFGVSNCWFQGDMEILAFFYGPVGILLVVNLALFALTARELTCGLWKRELVKSTSERAALGRVCMKLVVVMGVTWIADVISWAVGGPQQLWYLTDLINSFQGVFIFIVVGCQPQVFTAIKRLWCLRKNRENGTAGTTNHHSSSSQGMPSMGDTITNHSCNTTKSVPLETSC